MSILSISNLSKRKLEKLVHQGVVTSGGRHAAEFAREAAEMLGDPKIKGNDVWNRWLHAYLVRRLEGLPRTPSPEELACWADAVPDLGEAIPSAVSLLSECDVGFQGFWPSRFPLDALENYGDELVSFFVKRMQSTKEKDFHLEDRIFGLIEYLRKKLDGESLEPFLKAAKDKGFPV